MPGKRRPSLTALYNSSCAAPSPNVSRQPVRKRPMFCARPAALRTPGAGAKARHILRTALARRIEPAQALDRIAERIQAQRIGLAAGEYVEYPAALRVFARLHHRIRAIIAIGLQEGDQRFRLDRPARLAIDSVLPAKALRGGTRCTSAFTVVSTRRGPFAGSISRVNVAMRSAITAGLGETRSYGRQSHAGKAQHLQPRHEESRACRPAWPCARHRPARHAVTCLAMFRGAAGSEEARRSLPARRRWWLTFMKSEGKEVLF